MIAIYCDNTIMITKIDNTMIRVDDVAVFFLLLIFLTTNHSRLLAFPGD